MKRLSVSDIPKIISPEMSREIVNNLSGNITFTSMLPDYACYTIVQSLFSTKQQLFEYLARQEEISTNY